MKYWALSILLQSNVAIHAAALLTGTKDEVLPKSRLIAYSLVNSVKPSVIKFLSISLISNDGDQIHEDLIGSNSAIMEFKS